MSSTKTSCAAYRPDSARGVVVPFTTPQFVGARLRVNREGQFELLLRNPSGGKGVYLIELRAAHRFSTISLHDRILLAELLKLVRVSPRNVRLCARRVALWGAAGHRAHLAARAALRREEERTARLREHLVRRLETAAAGDGPSGETLQEAAREIAEHSVAIGLPAAGIPSDHAEVLRGLPVLAATLDKWRRDGADRVVEVAAEVARAAREAHEAAARELERRHGELADGRVLLARWQENRVELLEGLQFCDWLLDGWADRCALWQAAPATDRASQRAALVHIAKLLPPPLDVERDACRGDSAVNAFMRFLRESTDWRDEVRLAEIFERQEALRAELPA